MEGQTDVKFKIVIQMLANVYPHWFNWNLLYIVIRNSKILMILLYSSKIATSSLREQFCNTLWGMSLCRGEWKLHCFPENLKRYKKKYQLLVWISMLNQLCILEAVKKLFINLIGDFWKKANSTFKIHNFSKLSHRILDLLPFITHFLYLTLLLDFELQNAKRSNIMSLQKISIMVCQINVEVESK